MKNSYAILLYTKQMALRFKAISFYHYAIVMLYKSMPAKTVYLL